MLQSCHLPTLLVSLQLRALPLTSPAIAVPANTMTIVAAMTAASNGLLMFVAPPS